MTIRTLQFWCTALEANHLRPFSTYSSPSGMALVVIAVWILGVGTLMDLALVQMVGIITGTFSSVFLATPLLVSLKNRDPEIRRQTAKVLARREKAEAAA